MKHIENEDLTQYFTDDKCLTSWDRQEDRSNQIKSKIVMNRLRNKSKQEFPVLKWETGLHSFEREIVDLGATIKGTISLPKLQNRLGDYTLFNTHDLEDAEWICREWFFQLRKKVDFEIIAIPEVLDKTSKKFVGLHYGLIIKCEKEKKFRKLAPRILNEVIFRKYPNNYEKKAEYRLKTVKGKVVLPRTIEHLWLDELKRTEIDELCDYEKYDQKQLGHSTGRWNWDNILTNKKFLSGDRRNAA